MVLSTAFRTQIQFAGAGGEHNGGTEKKRRQENATHPKRPVRAGLFLSADWREVSVSWTLDLVALRPVAVSGEAT